MLPKRPSTPATMGSARRSVVRSTPRSHLFHNPPAISELEWSLIDLELRVCERDRKGKPSEFLLLGDTYPYDDLLQHCGATWCEKEELWKFSKYDQLIIFTDIIKKDHEHNNGFLLCDSGLSKYLYEEEESALVNNVRKKFAKSGEAILTDFELVVLFLSFISFDQNIRDVAKSLLVDFQNFGSLFCSDKENLSHLDQIDDSVVSSIKMVHAVMQRILREKVREGKRIGSWKALIEYLGVSLKFRNIEEMRVLYLDGKNRLIKEVKKWEGTVDHVSFYPREIVKDCILYCASSVILVHNHPSGDAMPSTNDIEFTNKIKLALESIDANLHDHVIIGKNTTASFRKLKLL